MLAVWNAEKIPDNLLTTFDWKGAVILIGALIAVRMKIGVIKVLLASGAAGLLLGLLAT
ncbi:MAG: hypothetical protein IKN27_12410 [Selenomonadaceae bacterium]|nr:hypothetical protein [Selenomonadaceae bacterium]